MTNNLKRMLKENAMPFPRSVGIPKADLDEILKEYPQIRDELYNERSIICLNGLILISKTPDEIIQRVDKVEDTMYQLQDKHTKLLNCWDGKLTEEDKQEKIYRYTPDEPFIGGIVLLPDRVYVPKATIDNIIRDHPELADKIYEYALIQDEGVVYPCIIIDKIIDSVRETENWIYKLEDWVNDAEYELACL